MHRARLLSFVLALILSCQSSGKAQPIDLGQQSQSESASSIGEDVLSVLENPAGYAVAYRESKSDRGKAVRELLFLSPEQGRIAARLRLEYIRNGEIVPVQSGNRWLLVEHDSPHPHGWSANGLLAQSTRAIDAQTGKQMAVHGDRNTLIHRDLHRVVQFRGSELWKAIYDWDKHTLVSESKVGEWASLSKMKTIAWAGNALYLHNRSNPEKPTVRISLEDGSFTELPFNLTKGGTHISPNGRFAVLLREELIFVLDMVRGETSTLSNRYAYRHPLGVAAATWDAQQIVGPRKNNISDGYQGGILWYNDQTLLLPCFLGGGVAINMSEKRPRIDSIGQAPYGYVDKALSHSNSKRQTARFVIRVGDKVLIDTMPGLMESPFLYDLASKERQPVGRSFDNGYWPRRLIDANHFVYDVKQGSLNETGAWVQSLSDGARKRLTIYHLNSMVGCHPAAGIIYFRPPSGGLQALSLADGSQLSHDGIEDIVSVRELSNPQIIPQPVGEAALWQPPTTERVLPPQDIKQFDPLVIDTLRYRYLINTVDAKYLPMARELRDNLEDDRYSFHDRHLLLKQALPILESGGGLPLEGTPAYRYGDKDEKSDRVIARLDFPRAFSKDKLLAYVFDRNFSTLAKTNEQWAAMPSSKQQLIMAVCKRSAEIYLARHLQKGLSDSYINASNPNNRAIGDALTRARRELGYQF